MKKKDALKPPPLVSMFEDFLRTHRQGNNYHDSSDWRENRWACHVDWIKPLADAGYIEFLRSEPAWKEGQDTGGRPRFNYHYFSVTASGINWWIKTRNEETRAHNEETQRSNKFLDRIVDPAQLFDQCDGKGIGFVITFQQWNGQCAAAMLGIESGYFEFVGFYSYPRGGERSVTVRLTAHGQAFFDALRPAMKPAEAWG